MTTSTEDVVRRVLDRHGRTYSDDAGIRLADEPVPLFQLLVLTQLLSARIAAGIAVAAARELLTGAGRVGLPQDRDRLAALVAPEELARFAAGLVRISLLPRTRNPFDG